MASTAQYWQPVWGALERSWKPVCHRREGAGGMSGGLPLAQAQSNRGRKGGKKDFPDAERLVKRLAQELILSFVPEAEQRLWRAVTRRKYQLTRNRVQLPNRLESLLEEAHSKLSSLVSDLLGVSAPALAEGETNPLALAALADQRLRASEAQLTDALGACTELHPVYRRLLPMALLELPFLEQPRDQREQEIAALLRQHEIVYRRLVPRLGHHHTIGAIAHRLGRLIWLILHRGVRYEERGPAVSQRSLRQRTRKMIRELQKLGYRVERLSVVANAPAPAQ